jgi:hypothetical protein
MRPNNLTGGPLVRGLWIGAGLLLALSGNCSAQTSASFRLEEYGFNAGGTPVQGVELTSASFSITLASLGDGLVAGDLSSGSFTVDTGFEAAYPPPGEVAASCGVGPCLTFSDSQTMSWPAERSAGVYNLYRDDVSNGYGNCEQQNLAATTATDPAIPPTDSAFFYLATVANRLGEEGTKGFQSNTVERLGAVDPGVCP